MIVMRRVRPSEVNIIQELNKKIFSENTRYDPDYSLGWSLSDDGKKAFEEAINDKSQLFYIAEEEGELLGYITAGPKEWSYRKSKYIEIHNLGIVAEHRRKGVATLLLDKIVEDAKLNGIKKIFLNCYIKNEEALNFYRRHGFSEIDVSLEKDI